MSYIFWIEGAVKSLHRHNPDLICQVHQVVKGEYEFLVKHKTHEILLCNYYCKLLWLVWQWWGHDQFRWNTQLRKCSAVLRKVKRPATDKTGTNWWVLETNRMQKQESPMPEIALILDTPQWANDPRPSPRTGTSSQRVIPATHYKHCASHRSTE